MKQIYGVNYTREASYSLCELLIMSKTLQGLMTIDIYVLRAVGYTNRAFLSVDAE